VFISGTSWTAPFRQYLQGHGLGSADYGYAVPAGATQPATLPWVNLNRVSIAFSSPVQVDASDLRVRGAGGAD
jgi:hypothetical protein